MAQVPSGTRFLGVDPSLSDLTEKKGTRLDSKTEYFSIEDLVAAVGPGPTGAQGIQGPAGPQGAVGPVGPAGLEWQGLWEADTSYAEDDAVSFQGASWFCISAVSGTGNESPNLDGAHWALLAAQGAAGATGATGAQGPTGPQGPAGVSGTIPAKTIASIYPGFFNEPTPITTDIVYATGNTSGYYILPLTTEIGKEITVYSTNGNTLYIKSNTGQQISTSAFGYSSQVQIDFQQILTFRYIGNDFWVLGAELRAPIVISGKTLGNGNVSYNLLTTNPTTSALTASQLNTAYVDFNNLIGFRVICPSIVGGGIEYTKISTSGWVSSPITAVS
jgi:hypothetical protein